MNKLFKLKLRIIFVLLFLMGCFSGSYIYAKNVIKDNIEYTILNTDKTAVVSNGQSAQGNLEIPSDIIDNGVTYKVTSIGTEAFRGSKIEGIIMPQSIKSIGSRAFFECKNLVAIGLSSEELVIEDLAFYDSGLTSVILPKGVSHIGDKAFSSCSKLKNVYVPSSVSYIPNDAFIWCTELESVEMEEGISEIKNRAFYFCTKLKSISIPNSVTIIGDGAFGWCRALRTVNLPTNLSAIGASAFTRCSSLDTIIIPDGVRSIGELAFDECGKLEYIEIPETVTYVGNKAFGNSGEEEMTKLKRVVCVKNSFIDNEEHFFIWNQYGSTYPEFSYKVSSTSTSGSIFGEYTFMSYISVGLLTIVITAGLIIAFRKRKNTN